MTPVIVISELLFLFYCCKEGLNYDINATMRLQKYDKIEFMIQATLASVLLLFFGCYEPSRLSICDIQRVAIPRMTCQCAEGMFSSICEVLSLPGCRVKCYNVDIMADIRL